MDTKTKIQTVISLVLVVLITALAYWAQVPSKDLKAQLIEDVDTVLVRIQDFAFDPDVVRIDTGTAVSWLHDESEGNADVQHTVTSYDPDDASKAGEEFESDLLNLGDIFTEQFNEPGVYNYNCSLYPFMTGKVCVGEESEELDDDCAIDLTDLEAGATEEEEEDTLLEDEEDLLPDLEELTLDEEEEEVIPDELETEITDEDDEDILFEAADEDFDSDSEEMDGDIQIHFDSDSDLSGNVLAADSASQTDGELSDSGPEDLIYLIPFIISLLIARKFAFKA